MNLVDDIAGDGINRRELTQLSLGREQWGRFAARDEELPALQCKVTSDFKAEAARGPRDQGSFMIQCIHSM
jgi:hypothetical protein